MRFETSYEKILEKIEQADPIKYSHTRNYVDGAVTQLSPYISRGVISTKKVLETVLAKGFEPHQIEKFIQELAWRDYWQQLWMAYGNGIDNDLKHPQPLGKNSGIPQALVNHQTGIEALDVGIINLYETGYLHNHLRMYVAAVACNISKCHWKIPAQWMYYHLLDADWASNALSWQWVAGANSNKLYYANQENINKYCRTSQRNTFLDVGYEEFEGMQTPEILKQTMEPELRTPLPETATPELEPQLPTLLYNFYNLDPQWRSEMKANRILLLEPSVFDKYPVSQKSIDFCLALAHENLPGIQVWTAEFSELKEKFSGEIFFKEHPLNEYSGTEDPRDWMTSVNGAYPSFFAFWKKCRKELFS